MKERRINLAIIKKIVDNPERVESAESNKLYYFGKHKGARIKIVLAKNREVVKIITVYLL